MPYHGCDVNIESGFATGVECLDVPGTGTVRHRVEDTEASLISDCDLISEYRFYSSARSLEPKSQDVRSSPSPE